jgi:hypothetical protein
MQELLQSERDKKRNGEIMLDGVDDLEHDGDDLEDLESQFAADAEEQGMPLVHLRRELFEIRDLLAVTD